MRFEEINPFIRYAHHVRLIPRNIPVRAYDCRIFYVVSGDISIHTSDRIIEAPQNTLVFIREGVEYRVVTEEPVDMLILNFDMSQNGAHYREEASPVESGKFCESHIFAKTELTDTDMFDSYLVIPSAYKLCDRVSTIVERVGSSRRFRDMQSSAMLKLLLSEVAEELSRSDTTRSNAVEQVLTYIKEHFSENMTNEDIGAFAGYHPNYINKLMLKSTGITLRQHIINTRIDMAKSLLQYSNNTIRDIAEQCGFSGAAYFSYRFRREMGVSPQEYRDTYLKMI